MDIVVPAGMSYEFYTELTSGSKNVQETPKVGGKIASNRNKQKIGLYFEDFDDFRPN